MSDKETLEVYAKAAQRYAEGVARAKDVDQEEDLKAFISQLPSNAPVLDLGCGPGQWASRMKEAGLTVEAMDASPEMAALAKSDYGLDVQVATFDDLNADKKYAGIWANFSLLHAPRSAFPSYLKRIHEALCPSGAFHIGTKLGHGEGRDDLGRYYAYYQEAELRELLTEAGFTILRSRTGSGTGLSGSVDTFVVITAHA